MSKLRVGVIDLVAPGPQKSLYGRVMNANLASIMPQAVAVWCEAEGHDVSYHCYTGFEDLTSELPGEVDLVFIGAFTEAALLAYALSNFFRSKGSITVLGGPHARCYADDARKYFDYVVGFTDATLVGEILRDCRRYRPVGASLAANRQPAALPGVRERWKFIQSNLRKALFFKMVPMLGSLGCPYTCSFCIDSVVPYQPLDLAELSEDLRFLARAMRRPRVGWFDPNFGVRFDDYLNAIDAAVPPGTIQFLAESSLSLLSEPHVKRLARSGFQALLPGVESWYELGNKSRTGQHQGMEKVRQVSEHVNLIQEHVPYVQTNFVLGLDSDSGPEPFELTKRFVDLTPGAFPGYSLLSAFGSAAPLNLEYQRANRVLPFPFSFLDNHSAMNVRPRNYAWPEFYDHVIDLTRHTFSARAIARRFRALRGALPRWMNVLRAVSSEGWGREAYFRRVRRRLDTDRGMRRFFEQETTQIPAFYTDRIRRDLGRFWHWLPPGSLSHDPNTTLDPELRSTGAQRGRDSENFESPEAPGIAKATT